MSHPFTGEKVIVRCTGAGVHFGTLVAAEGQQVQLAGARRLWRWHTGGAGISLSEVALTGIDQGRSRICAALPRIALLDVCEIIPATPAAAATIEAARTFKP